VFTAERPENEFDPVSDENMASRLERADAPLVLEPRELTPREHEVLTWVAQGKTDAETRLLWVAPSTVRKHLENVYAKLGVQTRTAAVARVFGSTNGRAS
jgi:DNA-binding CsgD family transcriptional regulator